MAIERRNPLPAGRYWQDIYQKDEQAFGDWLQRNSANVHIEVSESHTDEDPPRNWVLFAVSSPVQWEGPGFPTIAEESVHTSGDTAASPPPPASPEQVIEEAVQSAGEGIKTGLTVAGLGLVGYLLYKLLS